ncbi:MAG: RNA polymerase sigma factor [Butyrivibrio sp.]
MDEISLSYRNMYPNLYKRMLRMTGDGQLAQDIINEAFIAVMEHKSWWDSQNDATRQKYILDRCDAICQRHLEARGGRHYVPYDDEQSLALHEDGRQVEEAAVIRENLRSYMDRLPPEEYSVMHMKYFLDMSVAEIGEKLGVSEYAVYKRLSRARELLRRMMDL